MAPSDIPLRYGCNPHQKTARIVAAGDAMPLRVLSGAPGYINVLDALNAWQLVRELEQALGLPAAASFKHVSPAGAAVGVEMGDAVRRASFADDVELSPLAVAYARARGADRMSSFGDFAALSDPVDVPTARLLNREVSDGVIAPGYQPEALDILKSKRDGKYLVLEIDADYEPPPVERRDLFGLGVEQQRNDARLDLGILDRIVTANTDLPASAKRDLLVATVTLKYTQSNSVCFAYDGQVIGNGAGQQSRIHCTRLAAAKAETWWLRQHPAVLDLQFRKGLSRAEQNNAIDLFLLDDLTPAERVHWQTMFDTVPDRLSVQAKRDWIATLQGVSLSSDAFFPFRDCIDRAKQTGVTYIVQPGGSLRDDDVIAAADEYGMVMAVSGIRLFHH